VFLCYDLPLSCSKFCRRTLRRRQPLTRLPGRACQYCTKHKRLVVPEPRRHRCQSPTVHRKHNTIWLYIYIYRFSCVYNNLILLFSKTIIVFDANPSFIIIYIIMYTTKTVRRFAGPGALYKHTKSHLIIPRGSGNIVIILLDIAQYPVVTVIIIIIIIIITCVLR